MGHTFMQMSCAYRLRMFGALTLETDLTSITKFPTQRSALILARLAISKGAAISRDELAEQLWPDDFQDQTRLRLRQELSRLRQSSGDLGACIHADRQWVQIEADCLATDTEEFDEAIATAKSTTTSAERAACLTRALDLLRGPFLAGYKEPWVLALRRDYEEKARRAWLDLADAHLAMGQSESALRATLNAVRHAPLDPEANSSLVRRYLDAGQVARARQAFFEFDAMMFRELGSHAPGSLLALIADSSSGHPSAVDPSPRSRGAPQRPGPLYGRDDLVGAILAALDRPGARLLVVGAVGIGKSHVVAEAAWQFSRLSELPIQVDEPSVQTPDGLFILRAGLDSTGLADAIHRAAELGWRVLAESRVRLERDDISEILVEPLPVPAATDPPAAIRANPSVQILSAKVPVATDDGLIYFAELARRLDGVPVALKAFASRLRVQAPEQVLRSLDDVLREVSEEPLESGETITAAIRRACVELPDPIRKLFLALARLDGVSVNFAAKLVGHDRPSETWGLLERACLMTVSGEGRRARYRVPFPIAWAALHTVGTAGLESAEPIWRTLADWAYGLSRKMIGPDQEAAFDLVQDELPNLRTGMQWAIDADPKLAGLMALATWRTICARGNPSTEAELLFRAATAGADRLEAVPAGEVWGGTGIVLGITDRLDLAEEAYLQGLNAFERADDPEGQAWVKLNYACSVLKRTDPTRALQVWKEAADQSAYEGNRWIALCAYAMGLADMGEHAEAQRVAEEVFAARLQSPDPTNQARAYVELAPIYAKVGRSEATEPLLREGIRRLRETRIQDLLFESLLLLAESNPEAADITDLIDEAESLAQRIGSSAKMLDVALIRMANASRIVDRTAFIGAVGDAFRLTQIVGSKEQRERSLRSLAQGLRGFGKARYADTLLAAGGGQPTDDVLAGWKDLLSSDSHGAVCALAVAMAKEALRE